MPNVNSPLRPEWAKISQSDFRNTFRQFDTIKELAEFWEMAPFQLSYYAFHIDMRRAYSTFTIPRRNGGRERRIETPIPTLKYIQRLIHESLTGLYGPHPAVHGFRSERSIMTNARYHIGSRYILNIDLADFFLSINRQRIYGRLVAAPYLFKKNIANLIAALTTNSHFQLPQGSPSSPVIANIVAAGLDADLAKLCGLLGCRYTRYADDISISTTRGELPPEIGRYPNASGTGQVVIGDKLTDVIKGHGFRINDRKSRLQSYWTRQMCTGLVINGDHISPPRSYIRRLRSLVDHWQRNGWEDASRVLSSKEHRSLFTDRQKLFNHVIGRIAYIRMVRGQADQISQQLTDVVTSIPPGF